jgi:predicted exporter
MKPPGRFLVLAFWLAALLASVVVIINTRFVADLSAFMPKMPSERQQLLVEQLRDGVIARLVLIGIEGGDAAERARLSRELAASLRNNQAFIGVLNGEAVIQEHDQAFFFDNRYLLSPAVTSDRFSSEGLRLAIGNTLDALSGNAGLILKRLLPRDPTGEALQLLEQFSGDSQPRSLEGAWASRDGNRALLLAQTSGAGSDTEAQSRAIDSIRTSFEKIPGRNAETRLVMSGTGVFSVSSRHTIESEVSRLATAGVLLVIFLLLLVYRSFTLLALGLLPVLSGALAGIAAVSLGFGSVHGLTLGFGTTLIGEAVDYSIYLFIQRAGGANPGAFWRTIRLGVITSIAGFAALLFSGFPGLSQLGLYSISGLVAAVLVTRYVLPTLVPKNLALRDLQGAGVLLDRTIGQASHLRWLIVALLLGAGATVAYHGGEIWNRQLSALSPISKAEQQLDMELRRDLSAPDMRYMATFTAPDQETALLVAERAGLVLQGLVKQQVIGGFSSPAFVLPSIALQRIRQSALPDASQARTRLSEALAGMPLKAERLEGFLADLDAARSRQALLRADLAGTSAALLADSLLIKRDKDYLVLLPLRSIGANGATRENAAGELIDVAKVSAELAASNLAKVMVIDLLEETTGIFDSYLHEALVLSGLGCLAIIVLLLVALRSWSRTLRVAIPLVCAVLCVTAALLASGTQLTILHLVGLLLVVAVGSNYALFFDSGALPNSDTDRRQMQISLVVANLTTVGSFGLLALSKVPVLSAIGTTVGPGAFLALVFSAILARVRSDAHAH